MKKLFNLSYLDKVKDGTYKLETRDGRPAELLKIRKGEPSVVYSAPMIGKNDDEEIHLIYTSGRLMPSGDDSRFDLFVVIPEVEQDKRIVDFENCMIKFHNHIGFDETSGDDATNCLHQYRDKLLEIAKSLFENKEQTPSGARLMYDGRLVTDEEVNWKDVKVGDVVIEGDLDPYDELGPNYRILTDIDGPGYWEYFDRDGYYHSTSPEYCHWLVCGQKSCAGGELKHIKYTRDE